MSESWRPNSLPSLWAVLTMPVVTVFWRANGLPIATTNSPGLRSALWPRDSTGSFVLERKIKYKKYDGCSVTNHFVRNLKYLHETLNNTSNLLAASCLHVWFIVMFLHIRGNYKVITKRTININIFIFLPSPWAGLWISCQGENKWLQIQFCGMQNDMLLKQFTCKLSNDI